MSECVLLRFQRRRCVRSSLERHAHCGVSTLLLPAFLGGRSGWRAFNVAHGHLVPEGWQGFLETFGVDNIGQVRLNDNTGEYEIHLIPGEGNIDFEGLFARLRELGYDGWFSLGFGNDADKVRVRDWFTSLL